MKKIINNSAEEISNSIQKMFAKNESQEHSKRIKAGIARKKLLKTKTPVLTGELKTNK
jgi:hypothetical protein